MSTSTKRNKDSDLWVWSCTWDDWSWEDGYRCRAGSKRKPVSKAQAEAALQRHLANAPHPSHGRLGGSIGVVQRYVKPTKAMCGKLKRLGYKVNQWGFASP